MAAMIETQPLPKRNGRRQKRRKPIVEKIKSAYEEPTMRHCVLHDQVAHLPSRREHTNRSLISPRCDRKYIPGVVLVKR
jgi:hypothetical protein